MPEPALPSALRRHGPLRWLLAALLAALLFWSGAYDEAVFAALTAFWQRLLDLIGLGGTAQQVQQGVSGLVTTRSLPAMLSYGLLYTGVCLLILHLLLPSGRATRTALRLYAAVFAAAALLLLGGKLLGDVTWAYRLGRRLIDFIVSPLPVVVLVPLLRWQYSAPAEGESASPAASAAP